MGGIVVQKFDHPVMRNLIIAIFRQIGLCCHRCGEGCNQVRVEAVVTSSVLVFLFKVFPPNLSQLYFLSNSMPVKTPLTKNIHCDRKRIFYQELKISVIIALTTTILGKMYIAGLFIIVYCYYCYCYCSHTYYSLLLLFTDLLLFIVIGHTLIILYCYCSQTYYCLLLLFTNGALPFFWGRRTLASSSILPLVGEGVRRKIKIKIIRPVITKGTIIWVFPPSFVSWK